MVTRIFLPTLLFLANLGLFAQNGNPFITNFKPEGIVDVKIWDIKHDNDNQMFFATREGALIFDSHKWTLIETPSAVLSLEYHEASQHFFVGCKDRIGYISKNETGKYVYGDINSTAQSNVQGLFTKILKFQKSIYYFSQHTVVEVRVDSLTVNKFWKGTNDFTFSDIFKINDNLFISLRKSGLYVLQNDTIWPLKGGEFFTRNNILFSTGYDSSSVLLGTEENKLYTFDGSEVVEFAIEDSNYLKAGIIADAININENILAVSTVAGGMLLLDKKNGRTKYFVNYNSGLPDDEIYSIGRDLNNGIWVSHSYGLSRVDLDVPITSYHTYPGLTGNIYSALYDRDSTLYVGTSNGVYRLSYEKKYREKEKIKVVRVKLPVSTVNVKKAEENNAAGGTESEGESKKFRLFGKKNKETSSDKQESLITKIFGASDTDSEDEQKKSSAPAYRIKKKYVKEKVYELQSINYFYKLLPGLQEKCKQMFEFGDHKLIAANSGLYYIDKEKVTPLIQNTYVNYINKSTSTNACFVSTTDGVYKVYIEKGRLTFNKIIDIDYNIQYVLDIDENTFWLGGQDVAIQYKMKDEKLDTFITYPFISSYAQQVYPFRKGEQVYFITSGKIYMYSADTIILADELIDNEYVYKFYFENNPLMWACYNKSWQQCNDTSKFVANDEFNLINIFDNISSLYSDVNSDIWIINNNNSIFRLLPGEVEKYNKQISLNLQEIANKQGKYLNLNDLKLSYNENSLTINVTAPFYLKNRATEISYYIAGLMESWSEWVNNTDIHIPFIPAGKYEISIKSRDILGKESEPLKFQFEILPPFWKTKWFYALSVIFIGLLLFFVIRLRDRKLLRDKMILEQKVQERTREIERQKDKIELQNKEITDSINYAQKIQEALLPANKLLELSLKEYFVLYKPRDIVSGDFYWASQVKDNFVLVAADCTGHGVPGAFMSMLGISYLNELVKKENITSPEEILNQLRSLIVDSLNQSGKEEEAKDGMDISVCTINLKTKKMLFAGAFNPLYHVRAIGREKINPDELSKGSIYSETHLLSQVNADRMPVSLSNNMHKPFNKIDVKFDKGDTFYIFSDGYVDQFGGNEGKKYLSRNFKKKLLEIQGYSLEEQRRLLNEDFEKWKNEFDQIDDVLVMGFRLG